MISVNGEPYALGFLAECQDVGSLPAPDPDGRLTDPVKIANDIRKKIEKRAEAASSVPTFGVLTGIVILDENGKVVAQHTENPSLRLIEFLSNRDFSCLVGYNVKTAIRLAVMEELVAGRRVPSSLWSDRDRLSGVPRAYIDPYEAAIRTREEQDICTRERLEALFNIPECHNILDEAMSALMLAQKLDILE